MSMEGGTQEKLSIGGGRVLAFNTHRHFLKNEHV